ncbi:unnamed protein product [Closterium sp. NIES-64]|nr:unnamed protein product [Closterium sp. NIES-64]
MRLCIQRNQTLCFSGLLLGLLWNTCLLSCRVGAVGVSGAWRRNLAGLANRGESSWSRWLPGETLVESRGRPRSEGVNEEEARGKVMAARKEGIESRGEGIAARGEGMEARGDDVVARLERVGQKRSKRGGVRRKLVLEASSGAACGEGGEAGTGGAARGERRVIEAWRPVKGRYLLALCTYGRLSNQEACMHMYLALAALLNRTLIIPRHGFAISVVAEYRWQWGVIVNVPHMRSCLVPHYPSPLPAASTGSPGSAAGAAAAAAAGSATAAGSGVTSGNSSGSDGGSSRGSDGSSSSSGDSSEWSWQAANGEVPSVISQDEYEALEGRNLTVDRIACVVPHTCLSHPQMVFKALPDINFASHLEYPPLHSHHLDELLHVFSSTDETGQVASEWTQEAQQQGMREPAAASALASSASHPTATLLQPPTMAGNYSSNATLSPSSSSSSPPSLSSSSPSSSPSTSLPYAATPVLSLGDLNGLTLAGLPFDMFSPHPPFRLSCVDLWLPPPPVEGLVTGFIDTFLGGDYAAVHLRRSDFSRVYHHAHQTKSHPAFLPIVAVGRFIMRRLADRSVTAVYLATDASQYEVELLERLLMGMAPGSPLIVVRLPAFGATSDEYQRFPWVKTFHEAERDMEGGTNTNGIARALAEKHICARAKHFIGTPYSSYSKDIFRMREVQGLASCADAYIEAI